MENIAVDKDKDTIASSVNSYRRFQSDEQGR